MTASSLRHASGEMRAAWAAIDAFRASVTPGAWPALCKSDVVAGLCRRVAEPWRVDQGSTPLCGPASIVFELARRRPRRYVRIVRDLYERGAFLDGGGRVIRTSRSLLHAPPPARGGGQPPGRDEPSGRIPDVDWLLLATLREDENLLLPVTGSLSGTRRLKGLTTAWEMRSWCRRILGSPEVQLRRAKPAGDLGFDPGALDLGISDLFGWFADRLRGREGRADGVLRAASHTVARGGSAMLLVNSRLLRVQDRPGTLQALVPNASTHWVSLVPHGPGPNVVEWSGGSDLTLAVFTWGAIQTLRLDVRQLRRHLFAAVLAR